MDDSPSSPDSAPARPVQPPLLPPTRSARATNFQAPSAQAEQDDEASTSEVSSVDFKRKYSNIAKMMESFTALAGLAGDLSNVYRNRPIWCTYSTEQLVGPASDCYNLLPSSRMAVCNLLGLFIHEAAHQRFSAREMPSSHTNFSSVEEASVLLVELVEKSFVHKWSKQTTLDVFSWACGVACELYAHNSGRPCMQSARHFHSEHFLSVMLSSPAVKALLRLVSYSIQTLLKRCPDECLAVLFASRSSTEFNWILLHVSDAFSTQVVERLFNIGMDHFIDFIRICEDNRANPMPEALFGQMRSDRETQVSSFAQLFNFLMKTKSAQIKEVVQKLFKEGMDSESNSRDATAKYSFAFLVKMVIESPTLLPAVLKLLEKYVSPVHLTRMALACDSLPSGSLSRVWPETLDELLLHLDLDSVDILLETALHISMNPDSLRAFSATNESVVTALKEGMRGVTAFSAQILVRAVHSSDRPADISALSEISHGLRLQEIVDGALPLRGGPSSSACLHLLHAISVAFAPLKAAEIITRFLIRCEDENELQQLLGWLLSYHSFQPDAMHLAYENLSSIIQLIRSDSSIQYDELVGVTRLAKWIGVMMEWEAASNRRPARSSAPPHSLLRLHPGRFLGEVMTVVFSLSIHAIKAALKSNKLSGCKELMVALAGFVSSSAPSAEERRIAETGEIVLPVASFPLRFIYKIAIQMSAVLRFSLLLQEEDGGNGDANAPQVYVLMRNSFVLFWQDKLSHSLADAFIQVFVSSLVTGAFSESCQLFRDGFELEDASLSALEKIEGKEKAVLEELRSLALRQTVATLAHSGRIARNRKRTPASPPSITNGVRVLLLADSLAYMMSVARRDVALFVIGKHAAVSLVDSLCDDALKGCYSFGEWRVEKEKIASYLKVCSRVDGCSAVSCLLSVLARFPPSILYALPILKALLARIIVEYENAVHRLLPPSPLLLRRLRSWMALAALGEIVPEKLEYILAIVPHVSTHEGALLLQALWKHFEKLNITYAWVNEQMKNATSGQLVLPSSLGEDVEGVLVQICIRHIDKLGHLLANLLPPPIDEILSPIA